jgi:hypothetical protein
MLINNTETTNSRNNLDGELNHNNSKYSLTSVSKNTSSVHYENLVQKRINLVFEILDSN